jgi:hypothetical protein
VKKSPRTSINGSARANRTEGVSTGTGVPVGKGWTPAVQAARLTVKTNPSKKKYLIFSSLFEYPPPEFSTLCGFVITFLKIMGAEEPGDFLISGSSA